MCASHTPGWERNTYRIGRLTGRDWGSGESTTITVFAIGTDLTAKGNVNISDEICETSSLSRLRFVPHEDLAERPDGVKVADGSTADDEGVPGPVGLGLGAWLGNGDGALEDEEQLVGRVVRDVLAVGVAGPDASDRVQDRHQPLKAAAIVSVPFALAHIPGFVVETGSLLDGLVIVGFLFIPQLASRVIVAWFYNNTSRSLVIVGLLHAAYNATTQSRFTEAFLPVEDDIQFLILLAAPIIPAILIVIFTKRRLAYRPSTHTPPVTDRPDSRLTG
jgi:hypothetical protein